MRKRYHKSRDVLGLQLWRRPDSRLRGPGECHNKPNHTRNNQHRHMFRLCLRQRRILLHHNLRNNNARGLQHSFRIRVLELVMCRWANLQSLDEPNRTDNQRTGKHQIRSSTSTSEQYFDFGHDNVSSKSCDRCLHFCLDCYEYCDNDTTQRVKLSDHEYSIHRDDLDAATGFSDRIGGGGHFAWDVYSGVAKTTT